MSQNIGEKQKNYLFLKPIWKLLLQCCLQHPRHHQKTPTAPLSCGPCRYHIFGSGVFELEATIVLTPFLKEVYTVSYSDPVRTARFLWISVTFMGRLLMAISNWDIPMPCCLSRLPLPLGSVATTLRRIAEPMQLKKILPLCQVIFREARTPQRAHNTDPQTTVLPVGKGTGGAARTSRRVGTVWAHCEKMNLDLWADQPLARLPSWLYSPLHGAWGSAMVSQHSLASHMEKQSNSSAM